METTGELSKPCDLQMDRPASGTILDLASHLAARAEYHLAVLLLYRALEGAARELLYLVAPFQDWKTGVYPFLVQDFLRIRKHFYPHWNHLPARLGFADTLVVLHLLHETSFTLPALQAVLQRSGIRHTAWLSHGDQTPSESDYNRLAETFVPIIRLFLAVADENS